MSDPAGILRNDHQSSSVGMTPAVLSETPCGAKGTRTPGLLDANQTLFQLSYSPGCFPTRVPGAHWLERVLTRTRPKAQVRQAQPSRRNCPARATVNAPQHARRRRLAI